MPISPHPRPALAMLALLAHLPLGGCAPPPSALPLAHSPMATEHGTIGATVVALHHTQQPPELPAEPAEAQDAAAAQAQPVAPDGLRPCALDQAEVVDRADAPYRDNCHGGATAFVMERRGPLSIGGIVSVTRGELGVPALMVAVPLLERGRHRLVFGGAAAPFIAMGGAAYHLRLAPWLSVFATADGAGLPLRDEFPIEMVRGSGGVRLHINEIVSLAGELGTSARFLDDLDGPRAEQLSHAALTLLVSRPRRGPAPPDEGWR